MSQSDCPACRGELYVGRRNDSVYPGYVKMVVCPDPKGVHGLEGAKRLAQIAGLLPQELELRLSDVLPRSDGSGTAAMVALAKQFVEKPFGFLTLWGGYGNGKTLTLQAIVNELRVEHSIVGAYVRFYDLLEWIRAGFARDAVHDARTRYERIKALPLVAVDEMDGARMTEWADEFRRAWLDDRYRMAVAGEAHTVFAMNADPRTLPGDVWDRLRDGRFAVHHNPDPSARPGMQRLAL